MTTQNCNVKTKTETEIVTDNLLEKVHILETTLISLKDNSDVEPARLKECEVELSSMRIYLNKNKEILPGYIIKIASKIADDLDKFITSKKPKLKFAFKSSSKQTSSYSKPQTIEVKDDVSIEPDLAKGSSLDINPTGSGDEFYGFQDLQGKKDLRIEDTDTREHKDLTLRNLVDCEVELIGSINTVYIRNLVNTKVTICLASRAISVVGCTNCEFKVACQQLRIDSTHSCQFELFVFSRSMLENSTRLVYKPFNLHRQFHKPETIDLLFKKANFDINRNNWKLVDDFDWLNPKVFTENVSIIDE